MQDLNSTTHYFSETSQQSMLIADMPLPHVANAYKKLLAAHGEKFIGTPLATALAQRLVPSRQVAKSLLAAKGKCVYFCPDHKRTVTVRRFFESIGKALGTKVTVKRQNDFLEATCTPVEEEVKIKINRSESRRKSTFGR